MLSQAVFILGFILTILIGVVLGLVGGGGSILTVPLVHYCFDVSFYHATTYSLFIVGVAATVGVLRRIKSKDFSLREAVIFVIPSAFVAFIIRAYVNPKLPDSFHIQDFNFTRDQVISLLLVVLMLYTAFNMLVRKHQEKVKETKNGEILIYGTLTGCLAGILGAGGGFIIVPILMKMGLNIRKAVGTSMLIVALQSLVALFGDILTFKGSIHDEVNVSLLLVLTILTVTGVFIGTYLQSFFSGKILRKLFGYLLILVSLSIILERFF
jgi:uncharacterized protein